MNGAASDLSAIARAVVSFCILLAPLALTGLAIANAGLGRSRSASHAMLSALCVLGVAALAWFICGFAWQGYPGRPFHAIAAAGAQWNWIAAEPFFFRGLPLDGSPASLAAWLQIFSVALAALIPLGAGADRWRLGAACISTALLAGWTYPLFAHWVWGGGWLAQLGAQHGLGRGFQDAGGASTIQAVGGLTALAVAWIVGPRRGKFSAEGTAAIPGHNAVLVGFGALLALPGWIGINAAGSMLFAGAAPGALALIAVNTTLSAGMGALAAAALTRFRFGRPDASLCANGWFGALAASSGCCLFVAPAAAALIGLVAGALVAFSVELLDLRLGVDDPGGSISQHGIGGIWGLLAAGLFARAGYAPEGQMLAQLIGVATLIGFVLPLSYGLNWLLNRIYPQRVSAEGEWQGLDLYELGAGAYPEFVVHREDFPQR
ncbi:MAG: ammonium transporter [Bryobacteraceae bacterium]